MSLSLASSSSSSSAAPAMSYLPTGNSKLDQLLRAPQSTPSLIYTQDPTQAVQRHDYHVCITAPGNKPEMDHPKQQGDALRFTELKDDAFEMMRKNTLEHCNKILSKMWQDEIFDAADPNKSNPHFDASSSSAHRDLGSKPVHEKWSFVEFWKQKHISEKHFDPEELEAIQELWNEFYATVLKKTSLLHTDNPIAKFSSAEYYFYLKETEAHPEGLPKDPADIREMANKARLRAQAYLALDKNKPQQLAISNRQERIAFSKFLTNHPHETELKKYEECLKRKAIKVLQEEKEVFIQKVGSDIYLRIKAYAKAVMKYFSDQACLELETTQAEYYQHSQARFRNLTTIYRDFTQNVIEVLKIYGKSDELQDRFLNILFRCMGPQMPDPTTPTSVITDASATTFRSNHIRLVQGAHANQNEKDLCAANWSERASWLKCALPKDLVDNKLKPLQDAHRVPFPAIFAWDINSVIDKYPVLVAPPLVQPDFKLAKKALKIDKNKFKAQFAIEIQPKKESHAGELDQHLVDSLCRLCKWALTSASETHHLPGYYNKIDHCSETDIKGNNGDYTFLLEKGLKELILAKHNELKSTGEALVDGADVLDKLAVYIMEIKNAIHDELTALGFNSEPNLNARLFKMVALMSHYRGLLDTEQEFAAIKNSIGSSSSCTASSHAASSSLECNSDSFMRVEDRLIVMAETVLAQKHF